jgi:hypothetical protein
LKRFIVKVRESKPSYRDNPDGELGEDGQDVEFDVRAETAEEAEKIVKDVVLHVFALDDESGIDKSGLPVWTNKGLKMPR